VASGSARGAAGLRAPLARTLDTVQQQGAEGVVQETAGVCGK